jgi:hypothetical protein
MNANFTNHRNIRTKLIPIKLAALFGIQPSNGAVRAIATPRPFFLCSLISALMSACVFFGPGQSVAYAQKTSDKEAFETTVAYVVQFYPLWFTYNQAAVFNRLVGPERVTPLYQSVVAINVDTIYASAYLNLTGEPLILTIPPATNTYSILALDPYGDVFDSGIPPQTPGIYALIGTNGFNGTLPARSTPITNHLSFSTLIFRADKFSASGVDQTDGANEFRASLMLQTLSAYATNTTGGATDVLPEHVFAVPFKTIADNLIANDPIEFLRMLQQAVAASNTPPMSAEQQALSTKFDLLFGNGHFGPRSNAKRSQFAAGARAAHELILERYLTQTGPNGWIHFTNIGHWGDAVDERSGITEFIQYANDISAAAYYHTFEDGKGSPLNGSNPHGYVLTFPAGGQPEAKRFWSLTAYTPDAIELVPNSADKYVVARYTPGLQTNADGSLSVYMTRDARELPAGVSTNNWLPVPHGPFNIMLRVYGPEGSVTNNTYIPPAINRRH